MTPQGSHEPALGKRRVFEKADKLTVPDTSTLVCPRCGAAAGDDAYCSTCGLHLHDEPELPSRQAWLERQSASAVPVDGDPQRMELEGDDATRRGASPAELAGLIVTAVATMFALVALFLPWVKAEGLSISFWEFAEFSDAATMIVGIGLISVCLVSIFLPDVLALRASVVLAGMYFVPTIDGTVELLLAGAEARQAGAIMFLVACVVIFVGIIVVGQADFRNAARRLTPVGGTPLHLTATIMAVVTGAVATLALLLPEAGGLSTWESDKVADIVPQLWALAIMGIGFSAIFLPRTAILQFLLIFLAGYFGLPAIVGGIENLAAKDYTAHSFLVLLTGLLGLAVSILMTIRAYPRRRWTEKTSRPQRA